MPCPHNEISIVQRSQRQSAVAAAAYQSGEKLFCEYDQQDVSIVVFSVTMDYLSTRSLKVNSHKTKLYTEKQRSRDLGHNKPEVLPA